MKDITTDLKETAIISLVNILGYGDIFHRIVDEINKTNKVMPNAIGADKRHKVLANLDIIFEDLAVPVGEAAFRLLIELGVQYLKLAVITVK